MLRNFRVCDQDIFDPSILSLVRRGAKLSNSVVRGLALCGCQLLCLRSAYFSGMSTIGVCMGQIYPGWILHQPKTLLSLDRRRQPFDRLSDFKSSNAYDLAFEPPNPATGVVERYLSAGHLVSSPPLFYRSA